MTRKAVETAQTVTLAMIESKSEAIVSEVRSAKDELLHSQAEIKDMIAILQDVASPRRTKRPSLPARLDEISSADVEELEQIGEGSFGQVMKARYLSLIHI